MARRRYSDSQKAQALAFLKANGGNLARAARDAGVPVRTLRDWRDGKGVSLDADLPLQKEEDLANLLERVARKFVNRANEVAADTGARDSMVAAGIAIEKVRLLRDQPTQIQGVAVLEGIPTQDLGQMVRDKLDKPAEEQRTPKKKEPSTQVVVTTGVTQ